MRSLDVGCWKNPCCVFNLDGDKHTIFQLSRQFTDRYFVVGNVETLPFKNNIFDFIRANDIIEHVQNPEKFVCELHRCLLPSGQLFIRTPVYPYKIIYDIIFDRRLREWEDAHISKFNIRTFSLLIKKYFPHASVEPFIFKKVSRLGKWAQIMYRIMPRKICAVIGKAPEETDELYPYG